MRVLGRDLDRRELAGRDRCHVQSGEVCRAAVRLNPIVRELDATIDGDPRVLTTCDFDGGGERDWVACTTTGQAAAYRSTGKRRFLASFPGPIVHGVAADFDATGAESIVVGAGPGHIVGIDREGHSRFDAITQSYVSTIGAADLDGDGQLEIVATSGTGAIYTLDHAGKIIGTITAPGEVKSLCIGDWSGTGRPTVTAITDSGRFLVLGDPNHIRSDIDAGTQGRKIVAAPNPRGGADLSSARSTPSIDSARTEVNDGLGRRRRPSSTWRWGISTATARARRWRPLSWEARRSSTTTEPCARRSRPARRTSSQSPIIAPLVSGGPNRIVTALSDGRVIAWKADGTQLFESPGGFGGAVALRIAALDGGPERTILEGTSLGHILGIDSSGARRFDVTLRSSIREIETIDWERDGRLAIAAGTSDGQLVVVSMDRRWASPSQVAGPARCGMVVPGPDGGPPAPWW